MKEKDELKLSRALGGMEGESEFLAVIPHRAIAAVDRTGLDSMLVRTTYSKPTRRSSAW